MKFNNIQEVLDYLEESHYNTIYDYNGNYFRYNLLIYKIEYWSFDSKLIKYISIEDFLKIDVNTLNTNEEANYLLSA